MQAPIPRGITPRDRLDRVLNLLSSEVGPQLQADPQLLDWPIQQGHREQRLGYLITQPEFVLDAYQCLKMIRDRGHMIFSTPVAARTSGRLARELLALRNAHAHGEVITGPDAYRGSRVAQDLLRMFGLDEAASVAADLALPPSIGFVADLRVALVEAAKQRRVMTYEEALAAIGLPDDDVGYRVLFRQLNVLAAKQLILDEPQLCALVVLADEQIPGNGFYWVVDLDRDADTAAKRAAHAEAVKRVLDYRW